MAVVAGVGVTADPDSYTAGRQAAQTALQQLGAAPPRLLLAFTTEQYDQAAVVRGLNDAAAPCPVLGCCTGGLISAEGIVPQGVGALALGGDLDAALAIAPGLSTRPEQSTTLVGEQLEAHVSVDSERHSFALVFTDGLTAALTMDEALVSTAALLGPLCPIFGGAAGDSLNYGHTTLFVNQEVMSDALAVAVVSTTAAFGVGVRHGWRPIGQRLMITASRGNIIDELDGKPAIEVYRRLLPEHTLTTENFRAISRFHPIGFPQLNGEYLVRLPIALTPEGGIACLGTLPSHSIAHLMEGEPASLLDAAAIAAQRAMDGLEGRTPVAAIVIDCVTRPPLLGATPLLGGRSHEEIERIRAVIGLTTPLLGMYSFGELAADDGPPNFHNKTVAVCVIGG